MAIMNCPECGKEVSDKTSNCPHCGFPIYLEINNSLEKKKCPYCGTVNEHYVTNCKSCNGALPELEHLFKEKKEQVRPEILDSVFQSGTIKCTYCGYAMPPNIDYCQNCGSRLHSEKKTPMWMYILSAFITIIILSIMFSIVGLFM